jgi:hypothetical protein
MSRFYILFSLLLISSACSLIEPANQDIQTIQKDFTLGLFERIDLGQRQLQIVIKTTEKQKCENSQIALSIQNLPNSFVVRLEDIVNPDESECIAKEAYITNDVPLIPFTGTFDLFVQIRDVVENRGVIRSSQSQVSFHLSTTEGVELENNVLNRISQSLIWGRIGTDNEDSTSELTDFFNTMEANCQPVELEKGYYGYFNVTADGDPEMLDLEEPKAYRDFAFVYQGNPSELFKSLQSHMTPNLIANIKAGNGRNF